MNVDIDAEGLLETATHLPAIRSVVFELLVGERNLGV